MRSSERQESNANFLAESWVDDQLGRLTPRRKLAQRLIALPGVTDGRPDAATRAALRSGLGVLHGLVKMSVSGAAQYHLDVAELCAQAGLPPALVSANLEAGVGYTLGGGGTDFPYPRGVGLCDDPAMARDIAELAAREARLVGFHWTFSPCIDVVTTPDDPILGVRAFGAGAARTAVLGAAQVLGYQSGGLLATAKHYPGHGDSATDTHSDLAFLTRTPGEHDGMHLLPFRAAVAAGVASVMVAHVALPQFGVDGPASLSPLVNRTWLREDLGFDGIIVTDALRMGAIAARWSPAEAAVASLAAGADVANVKVPAEEIPAILDVLEAALAAGQLDADELDRSVARLLRAKVQVGLHQGHGIDLNRSAELDTGRAWDGPELARTVSTRSQPRISGPAVVVGDSELARRLAARLDAPHEAVAVTEESLVPADQGATVIAVACPLPVDGGRDSEAFAAAVGSAREAGADVIAVVNSVVTELRVDGPSVSVPAVDAFGMVSNAAVEAVVAALR